MARGPVTIWKKRILIPFWVVRICLTLIIIAAYGWAIKHANDDDNLRTPRIGAVVVFMLFLVAVLLIDVLAILLFARDALKPGTFLTMNSFQTGFWIGSLILEIVYVARGESAVALGFSIFVLFTYAALLVYAIIKYNKEKKELRRGHYAPALNPSAPPAPGYHPPAYMNAAPYQQQESGFHAQNTSYVPPASKPLDEHNGAAASYYNEMPAYGGPATKPTQMV